MNQYFSEELQTLIDLGLTILQGRVYLTLNVSRFLKISEIAEISKVARPDIYRTVLKLQEKGLVEKEIGTPIKYKAIPMEKGLSHLLSRKADEFKRVEGKTEILLKMHKGRQQLENQIQLQNDKFVLIPKGKLVIDRISSALENASKSVDLILSWKRFAHGIADTFIDSIEIAWKKNIDIRFIVGNPYQSKTAKQLIRFCEKQPSCQIRFCNDPKTVFGIYDNKAVFISVDPKADLYGSPALWSSSHSLLSLCQGYFDFLWLTSTETISQCLDELEESSSILQLSFPENRHLSAKQ